MEPISIYVHIPMCVKKCAYCDFTSYCGRMNQRDAYTEAVCREMREQAAFFGARRVNTVFFGGGTPTLMTGAQMERMMDTLRACFDLAADAEVTMEGNPGTLTRKNLDAYRKAVQFYFPGADIQCSMTVRLCQAQEEGDHAERHPGVVLDLFSLL